MLQKFLGLKLNFIYSTISFGNRYFFAAKIKMCNIFKVLCYTHILYVNEIITFISLKKKQNEISVKSVNSV